MKINIRMEGGLGDHLAANRFVPAILDKYPDAKIKLFSDTENNPRSLDLILKLFPSYYARGGKLIEARKSKTFDIVSQFGKENYPASLSNQTPEILKEMVEDCDRFYDLHIDGLKWTDYEFDWLRYYYFFPKPQIQTQNICGSNYIMTHLYARPDSPYNLDKNYTINLINKLSEFNTVLVLVEEKYKEYYSSLLANLNVIINTTDSLETIFNLAANCSCYVGIDSGIRYVPYHFSKPTFVFSNYCQQYGQVAPSHLIRWLIFSKNVFPINFDINTVCKIISNCSKSSTYALYPELLSNIDQYIVRRIYEH